MSVSWIDTWFVQTLKVLRGGVLITLRVRVNYLNDYWVDLSLNIVIPVPYQHLEKAIIQFESILLM